MSNVKKDAVIVSVVWFLMGLPVLLIMLQALWFGEPPQEPVFDAYGNLLTSEKEFQRWMSYSNPNLQEPSFGLRLLMTLFLAAYFVYWGARIFVEIQIIDRVAAFFKKR